MAPSHRLAAGLSDEGTLAGSRLQQNPPEQHHAVEIKDYREAV